VGTEAVAGCGGAPGGRAHPIAGAGLSALPVASARRYAEAHGQTCYADAAAYDPAGRTWRKLPSLPAPRFAATLTWTGREVLVAGGTRSYSAVPYATVYAYRPSTVADASSGLYDGATYGP